MDTTQILRELATAEGLPVEAIRAAREQRATLAPAFVQLIERFVAGTDSEEDADAIFLVFHLLGEWREKSAYRPLAALLRLTYDDLRQALSDAVTETSHRVMAAVFDGDARPLHDVIRDPDADEIVRSRMCEALAMVTLRGELPREQTAAFLRACFHDLAPQDTCFVWEGWQHAIALLGLVELAPLVREAFARELIDPGAMSVEDFERDLAQVMAGDPALAWHAAKEFELFGDTIAELSTWSFARPDEEEEEETGDGGEANVVWRSFEQGPAVNQYRDVGRNDPCPCGSGKKFKKCCLGKVEAQERERAASARFRAEADLDDRFPSDDDDLGSPITAYDPLVEPNPDRWLALEEDEALRLVKSYHRRAGIDVPDADMHAIIHLVVENQIADGDALPVRRKLDALVREGLDRHDAVHAIGAVLAMHLREVVSEAPADKAALDTYFAELAGLTAASWRRDFG
jgi:hypothetical protein